MPASPAANAPIVAGRYRLEGLLGRGGMGSVWRALDLRDGRVVAVKLLESEGRDVGVALRRFLREAETVATIESEHVVRLYDYGVEGDAPYMVMELLEGESLEALLAREGRLAPQRLTALFTAIARGVDAAHRARVVHRDLKPANVFLSRDGAGREVVKVLDFGVVKRREADGDSATLTQSGAIVGTPYYMSPEQAQGSRDLDHRSDLWSLAVIAFRALTGALPFRGALTALLVNICVAPIPRPSSVAPVPAGFDAWFARGAAREPGERFRSALEMAEALEAACADAPTAPPARAAPGDRTDDALTLPPRPAGVLAVRVADELRLAQLLGRAFNAVAERADALAREAVEAAGGVRLDEGVFALPHVTAALHAAVAVQRAVQGHAWAPGAVVSVSVAVEASAARPVPAAVVDRARRLALRGRGEQILLSPEAQADAVAAPSAEVSLVDLGRHHLDERGGAVPVYQAVARGIRVAIAPPLGDRSTPNNLPPDTTEFVGREAELAALRGALDAARLVTLRGPGGVGKTRLALRAARGLLDRYADGVFFVPMAHLGEAARAPSALAAALGVAEQGQRPVLDEVAAWLAPRAALLVVDNAEHIADVGPVLAAILDAAPSTRALVTSRAALGVDGEHVYDVPLLALPDAADDLDALLRNDAVGLFVRTARRVDPTFALLRGNAAAVVDVVRRAEGLCLAVELAAAQVGRVPVEQLARRLGDPLALRDVSGVVDARHRRLGDVVRWSYELLGEAERAVLRRVSVFSGGFGVAAAEAVAQRDAVEPCLQALVLRSLLRREIALGEERFTLLGVIRQFGLAELDAAGEREAVTGRHLDVFAELAAASEAALERADATATAARLALDEGNLRAALTTALARDPDRGLAMASSLWRYWQSAGRLQEGRRWLVELLARPEVRVATRAAGLSALAGVAYWQADYATAALRYGEALALYEALGDARGVAEAHFGLSTTATWRGEHEAGERHADIALEGFAALGAHDRVGMVTMARGFARWMKGDLAGARPLWERSIAIAREVGDDVEAAHKALALASITWAEGHRARALGDAVDAMRELYARGNLTLAVMALDFVASMAVEGAPAPAARLASAASTLRKTLGGGMRPESCGLPEVRACAALDADSLERAWAAGRALSLRDAVREAEALATTGSPLRP